MCIAECDAGRRRLVARERRERGRADAIDDTVDRVRRTAQRVRDTLRRSG